jgi:hypothetical protein
MYRQERYPSAVWKDMSEEGKAMDEEKEHLHVRVVLCASSAYDKKYYFNRTFDRLPQNVKDELQIICVTFTEDVGGIFTIVFTPTGDVEFETQADEGDLMYDEIGCGLKIKEIRKKHQELLQSLSIYYKVTVLHQNPAELLDEDDGQEDRGEDGSH